MGTKPLELDEAIRITEMAFLPCRAVAHADAQDASYSLRVLDEADCERFSIAHIGLSQYRDPVHLAALIEQARLELSKDGLQLAPWSMPGQPGLMC